MNVYRFVASAVVFCIARLGYVLALVAPLIVEPVMSFIRDAPAAAAFLLRLPARLVAFVVISILKPIYLESYRTNGLSLGEGLRPA
ncbi:hypothetical protein [Shinella sp. BYT-45]|uniref:hypothetical protein n=1 Tax=Shinella sp. BYT-45 TaxID=3377377 RepID=UPI00397E9CF7